MSSWTVPGYAEEREIGRGASGRVVEATSESSGRHVAIKYLSDKLFRDPDFLAEFRAEAQLLEELDVPQVVRVFDYVEQPGQGAAIVMELVDGVSLHELISRRGETSPESALVVLKGSLLGLAAAHALGVVHRDYKPENVLVDRSGASKLSDFGVAVRAGQRVPSAGTPLYMAPEQWAGDPASPATDIYAATAVFFECLTGRTPFSGRLRQLRRQHETAPIPSDEVDEPLRGLVESGLAKDPAARPPDAGTFVAELEEVAAAAYGADWEERGRSQLAERAAALLLLLVGVVGAGGGVSLAAWVARHKVPVAATTAVVAAAAITIAGTAIASQSGNHNSHHHKKVSVTVKPKPPTVAAAANVTPPATARNCRTPATFRYTATLTAAQKGAVTYRWVYSSGKTGPVQTTRFAAAGAQQITGGLTKARATGTGWAEVQVISPIAVTSNKATYQLTCTKHGSVVGGIRAVAAVTPPTTTVTCGVSPPSFTFTGTISTAKAETVRYYWLLGNGTSTLPETLSFAAAGTKAVQDATFTPPGDTYDGSAAIVVTSPVATASNTAVFTLACLPPGHIGTGGNKKLKLSASAKVAPKTKRVACSASPPSFTFTGTITANEAATVTYHWSLSNGTSGPTRTMSFTGAGTQAVVADTFTPHRDTYAGSAMIVVTAPVAVASGTAAFTLSCRAAPKPPVVSAAAAVAPAAATVDCGTAPPVFTFTGTITSSKAATITYHWALSNGTVSPTATLAFAGAGTEAVADDAFTPPGDTYDGSAMIVVTAPVAVASNTAAFTLGCAVPLALTSAAAVAPAADTVVCGTATPAFEFTGTITVNEAADVTYHWALSDGTVGPTETMDFAGAATEAVVPEAFTPPADTYDGSAAIVVTAPLAIASNTAAFTLGCTEPLALAAAAAVDPPADTVVCGTAPPAFEFTGTITTTEAADVTYHWAFSDGTVGPTETLAFAGAATEAVDADAYTPAGDTFAGSGAIVVTAPLAIASTAAAFTLGCTEPLALTAAAAVAPTTSTVDCSAGVPSFMFTGTITSNEAGTVTYHWAFSDGTVGPTETLTFAEPGTEAVVADTFTPSGDFGDGDDVDGSGMIDVTAPVAVTSNAADFMLMCVTPDITVTISSKPTSPDSVGCDSTPPTFTVIGTISSNEATDVTYDWMRSDGTTTAPATVAVGAGETVDVTDTVTPPSTTYSGSDTLEITAPVEMSTSIPITVTCTTSVTDVTIEDATSGTDNDGVWSMMFTIDVTTTGPGDVTLDYATSESNDGSPSTNDLQSFTATLSGADTYSETYTVGMDNDCTYSFWVIQANATGTDGVTYTATPVSVENPSEC